MLKMKANPDADPRIAEFNTLQRAIQQNRDDRARAVRGNDPEWREELDRQHAQLKAEQVAAMAKARA